MHTELNSGGEIFRLGKAMKKYNPEKWRREKREIQKKRFQEKYPRPACPSWITFTHTVEPDDYYDISWVGKFTSRWEPGAIFHSNDPREYKWFVPENSFESAYRWYQKNGYSKQVAYELSQAQVRQDYELAKNYESVVICVTMYMHGEKVDTTCTGDVLLGDDYKLAKEYESEVVEELKHELLSQYSWKITTKEYAYA